MHIRSGVRARIAVAIAVALGATIANPLSARADVASELHAARLALARYDVHGGTVAVIRRLGPVIARARGGDRREALFLRSVAAADLLLIAHGHRYEGLRPQVASALGATPDALIATLDAELAALEVGVYAEVVRDCRWALRAIQTTAMTPAFLAEGSGQRRDVLFVSHAVNSLGQADEIDRLAALAVDPCSSDPQCDLRGFATSSRRAVAALREAERALTRLEEIADSGEPLSASLAAIVATDGTLLRTSELRATPALPSELRAHPVGELGRAAQLDLVVSVQPGQLQYAFVPAVQVGHHGLRFVSAAQPAMPSWETVRMRDDGRTVLIPYDDLVERFTALARQLPGARVGIAASSEVQALTVSRVLLSAWRAGLTSTELVAPGPEREARSVPVAIVAADGASSATDLSLFVRMGGYTLSRGPRQTDIPRVRDARGLRFDVGALEQHARAAGHVRATMRYMSAMEWGTVVDAAFHLRPHADPLDIVLQ